MAAAGDVSARGQHVDAQRTRVHDVQESPPFAGVTRIRFVGSPSRCDGLSARSPELPGGPNPRIAGG
jgi:hypothetical protein